MTTYGRLNHAVRSENYRYIRYEDGTEELYDHRVDPMEWTNLSGDENYRSVKEDLARWLPDTNAPEAPVQPQKIERMRWLCRGRRKLRPATDADRHGFGRLAEFE